MLLDVYRIMLFSKSDKNASTKRIGLESVPLNQLSSTCPWKADSPKAASRGTTGPPPQGARTSPYWSAAGAASSQRRILGVPTQQRLQKKCSMPQGGKTGDVCGHNGNQAPSSLIALACSVNPGGTRFLIGVCRDLGRQCRWWER